MAVKKRKRRMMRPGRGKAKGSAFERRVCKALSLWVSGGEKEDCFWRSAMSGGRATVGQKSGRLLARQAGDICAVAPEGHSLTDRFYIECKAHRNLQLDRFIIMGTGVLGKFWRETQKQARKYGRRPMMIVKQNGFPLLMLVKHDGYKQLIDEHHELGPLTGMYLTGELADFDVVMESTYNAYGRL